MLKSLHIENYRGFHDYTVDGLSRVNLFIGANNSGKTTILEAAQLLSSKGNPECLYTILSRRAEFLPNASEEGERHLEVAHLYNGHRLRNGISFSINSSNGSKGSVRCTFNSDAERPFSSNEPVARRRRLVQPGPALELSYEPDSVSEVIPLDDSLGLDGHEVIYRTVDDDNPFPTTRFLPTSFHQNALLRQMWNKIVLTPEEDRIVEAMRIILPSIERIAFIDTGRPHYLGVSDIYIKEKDAEDRIPMGSMGEGTGRLFALALSAVQTAGGSLFIDEIDTGLHYSVLHSMWRLMIEIARRVNIQIFATSHSLDCLKSLDRLYKDSPELLTDVSVHRIDRDQSKSIRYSPEEIAIAIEHDMEIR